MMSTSVSRSRNTVAVVATRSTRMLSTDTAIPATTASSSTAPPPSTTNSSRTRARLNPSPRPASTQHTSTSSSSLFPSLPPLPAHFGQNQLLPIDNSTRAILESIVSSFRAPIRYAFAYGSGVFEQDGYASQVQKGKKPMLDFMFAVTHPGHWHSINMAQHPAHYALHARALGSDFVSRVQEWPPGVWFNTFVKVNDVSIKYGVTTIDNLCTDLLTWQSLYLAGRMHKPLRIIKDDARVRLTQQVNLTSALRAALLTLPPTFTETELFERVSSISYEGDLRMYLPAENRSKVQNIVKMQREQFRELYRRLAVGLPGVQWPLYYGGGGGSGGGERIHQDDHPAVRAALLKKLPEKLAQGLVSRYTPTTQHDVHVDPNAFWTKVAEDQQLSDVLRKEMRRIVAYPAAMQTAKGLVSAGIFKSTRYGVEKMKKWWVGSGNSSSSPSDDKQQ